MKVLSTRLQQKQALFERYRSNLADLPLTMQPSLDCAKPNCWLSAAVLDKGCGKTPADILNALNEANIEGRHLWKPMHSQPVFRDAAYVAMGNESVSDDLFARGICLPSDTKMCMDDVDRVCDVIRRAF